VLCSLDLEKKKVLAKAPVQMEPRWASPADETKREYNSPQKSWLLYEHEIKKRGEVEIGSQNSLVRPNKGRIAAPFPFSLCKEGKKGEEIHARHQGDYHAVQGTGEKISDGRILAKLPEKGKGRVSTAPSPFSCWEIERGGTKRSRLLYLKPEGEGEEEEGNRIASRQRPGPPQLGEGGGK